MTPLIRHLDQHERAMLRRSVDDWLSDLHDTVSQQSASAGEPPADELPVDELPGGKSAPDGENGIVRLGGGVYKGDGE